MPKKKGVKKRPRGSDVLKRVPSAGSIENAKTDVSILKLFKYIAIFFIPVIIFMFFALKIGAVYTDYFEASPAVTAKILMVPFMLIIFYWFIPYVRDREQIQGIRYSILALFIIGAGLTLPSAVGGHYSEFLTLASYFASYVLMTFFFCPEVLGIERTMQDWFRHRRQLSIVFIYVSIVLLYVVGFAGLYYDIYSDVGGNSAFAISSGEEPALTTFIYYSMVSWTTTGYGEILPVSPAARLVFFIEALLGLVMNVLFIAILLVFVSNAEFLTRKAEEKELVSEMRKEEQELKREEKEIRKVEKEVEDVEQKENFMMRFFKLFRT